MSFFEKIIDLFSYQAPASPASASSSAQNTETEEEALQFTTVHRFLAGTGTDHKGRTLRDVLVKDDAWWEDTHDFIQWLFPAVEASEFNPSAPVLQVAEFAKLGKDPRSLEGMLSAYHRMLDFLGLTRNPDGSIRETPRPAQVPLPPAWMRRPDHNDKRISRMLRCLHLAGLQLEANALLTFLCERFAEVPHKEESLAYWLQAVKA